MAALPVQDAGLAGAAVVYTAANAGGDSVQNNGLVLLHFKNVGGSPITVTIDDPGTPNPGAATAFNPDVSVVVPATTGDRIVGPFPPFRFNDANGNLQLAYTGVTGLTVGVIRART
jgi:hypothetical protein